MDLISFFILISAQFNLPPGLLSSVCYIESTHRPAAISHNDGGTPSFGVCQVKYKTAKWLGFKGTPSQLMNPEVNIFYAGKYLHYQLKRYHGNTAKAVIAYNFGNAKNLTTSVYQRKVFNRWKQ